MDGHHVNCRDHDDQLETHENRYVVQLDGEVAKGSFAGEGGWHLGLMAGYGNSRNDSSSSLTGYGSIGGVDGYSARLYGTWFQPEETRKGVYIDTWLQHVWLKNQVEGDGLVGVFFGGRSG